ncbi:hypothetical protein [Actinoplanes sp. NPDC049802]|uniref:hypothetical protein n=1 Tax=Actinoplanes sp. NPDC049802 TaxID=3154742 RepID=UPI0033C2F6B5
MAAVVACLLGPFHLAMAALSATAFDVARSTAGTAHNPAWESAAGSVWLASFIVQALLAFIIAFGWAVRRGTARQRLARAGVRTAVGVLLLTLIVVAVIIALGLSQDAFRGSTIVFCLLFGFSTALGVGSAAVAASAMSDRNRAR